MSSQTPKMKANAIIQIKGQECSTYNGKLDLAHQYGIASLTVNVLQHPSPENSHTCICQAELETTSGNKFAGIADATPDNVPKGCAGRYISIASTRAKSRVFADAFNIQSTLGEESEINEAKLVQGSQRDIPTHSLPEMPHNSERNPSITQGGGMKPISDKQVNLIESLATRQGSTGEAVAQQIVQKTLYLCTGADANAMIHSLNNDTEH